MFLDYLSVRLLFWFTYRKFCYLNYDKEIFQVSLVLLFLLFMLCKKKGIFCLNIYIFFYDHILKCMSNNENVVVSYVAFITLL